MSYKAYYAYIFTGSSKRVCYINDEDSHTTYGEVLRFTGDIVHVKGQGYNAIRHVLCEG
jgi:hypothetical protein